MHHARARSNRIQFYLFSSKTLQANSKTMTPRSKVRRTKSSDSGTKTASGKISTMVTTLALLMSTNLFLASSALLFEGNQGVYHRSITRSRARYIKIFPGVLGYGAIDDTNDAGPSDFGSSSPDPLTPLPTSNDYITPEEVVTTCMSNLQRNGRAGLEICYNFSSDACRMGQGGTLESFLQHVNNPVFQSMVDCARWEIENVGTEIPATPTRGSMQTVLVYVVPRVAADESAQRNDRKFLWTIMKERRPPRQGHCLVHECIALGSAFDQTI